MSPRFWVNFTPDPSGQNWVARGMNTASTPYEPQRGRLIWMETVESLRRGVSRALARQSVARATRLSPDQIIAIQKRRRKDLSGRAIAGIDAAFVAWAQREMRTLEHELAMAHAAAGSADQRMVAKAKASLDTLEQLIRKREEGAW